ncbi:uncharacterized protein AMSG_05790 [Thecamonas trahens ATCC 50062]|uniref:Uncharacterized protein n=1 Tax=Thecamonas trahens ATCC 50062 TaxID=461836 RepID=A0A0L0DD48_THETB|nr:hypothetical protein AMSG_05790 [Thecamonas trahens ATCC 50062]KNC50031.1 hypothetical protein AMSG_05790 [Thecamonas trahens ATCC 50062]|eukprot:XP_013757198.1 hypothetical protein AMSG_05790 [Thecamonas trahens ATCC 50062]
MVPATLTLDIDETWVLESAVLSASFAGIVDADIPLTPDARSLDLTPVAPLIVRPASADPADNELVITVRAHLVPDFRLPLNDWAPSTAPDLPLSATLWHAAAPATYPGIVATRAAPALSLGLRATAATDGSALVDLSLAHVRGFDLAYSDAAAAAIVITLDLDAGMPYAFDTSSFAATAALVGAQLEVSPNERSLVITADPALALELAASATASLVLTPSDAAAACASCDLSGGLTGSVTFVPGGSCAGVNQGARLLGVSEPYAVISRNPPSLAGLTSIGCYEYAVFEGDDYGTDCNAATADPTPLSELPCGWEVAPNSGEVYHALAAKLCSAGAAASAASTFDSFSATCAWGASCLILADGTGITPEGKPCASNALVSVTADLSCATTRMVGVDGVDGGRVLLRRLSQLCGSAGVCGSGKRSWNMIDPAAAPFNLVPAQLTLDAPADWAVGANALAPLSHVPAISITAGTSLSATFNVEDPILSHAGRAVLTIGYEAKVGSSVVLTAVFDGWLPGLTLSGNIATGRFDIGVPAGVKEIILMVSNTASDDLAFIRGIELAVVPTRSTADGTCMDPATSGFNILANPSFDEPLAPVEAGMIGTWAPYMGNSGGELVHTGSALSLVNSDSSDDIIVGQRVELASPQTAFFIAAQVTTDAVSDGYAPYLSIYIDAELESGEWDYGKHVAIKPGTTAASMITGSVRYDEPVVALTVYVMHRFHTGALVVDEVSVLPYPYACADIPLAAAYGDPHIRSYDGLDWSFQASGDFVLTGTRDYSATTRIAAAGSAAVNAGAGVSLAGRPAVAIIRTDPPAPGLPIAWPRIALRLPGAAEWQTLDTSAAVAPGAPLDGELDVGDAARATVRISYGWSGAIDAAAALRLQVDYIGSGGFGLKVNVLASSYNVQYLYIRPVIPAFTQGQIFGLLGTPDGDESNDIKASDGSLGSPDNTAFIYSSTFVNSWRARNDALPGTADLVVPHRPPPRSSRSQPGRKTKSTRHRPPAPSLSARKRSSMPALSTSFSPET